MISPCLPASTRPAQHLSTTHTRLQPGLHQQEDKRLIVESYVNVICTCLFMSWDGIYKRTQRELTSVNLQIRNHWYQHLFMTSSSHIAQYTGSVETTFQLNTILQTKFTHPPSKHHNATYSNWQSHSWLLQRKGHWKLGKQSEYQTTYATLTAHFGRIGRQIKTGRSIVWQWVCEISAKFLALDEESSYLTTFLITLDRYRYLRAPISLSSSLDEWCHFIIKGFFCYKKIVYDILILANSIDKLELHISCVLKICGDINVTISRKKFTIATKISLAGFLISYQGIDQNLKRP